MIEALVVVSIIGLLVALILPAVQAARGSMRRLSCASKFREFGVALANYESQYGSLPMGIGGGNGYSFHVALLPNLDNQPLYNAINLAESPLASIDFINKTSLNTHLNIMVCPSDAFAGPRKTSYAGCLGDHRSAFSANGVFGASVISSRDITDGSSTTTAMSEALIGRDGGSNRTRTLFVPSNLWEGPAPGLTGFTSRCRSLDGMVPDPGTLRGAYWASGQRAYTLYDHTMTPNQPSCLNVIGSLEVVGSYTANSLHGDGVNCLFADGHVQFVRDSINEWTWRNLSTRQQGEIVGSDQY